MNKVILIGRLTKDPDIRATQTGTSVTSFTLAVDRHYKNADGERIADFIRCIAWSKLADIVGKYLHKGDMAAAFGTLQARSFENKDGLKQVVYEVVCEEIKMIGSKRENNSFNGEALNLDDMPF